MAIIITIFISLCVGSIIGLVVASTISIDRVVANGLLEVLQDENAALQNACAELRDTVKRLQIENANFRSRLDNGINTYA